MYEPSEPSIVLLGLTLSINLCLPNKVPHTYANTSLDIEIKIQV